MAQVCDFQINGGIEWKIALPLTSFAPSTSPIFSLLGSDWRLHFTSLNKSYPSLVVSLIPERREGEGDTLLTPFEVVTYLKEPSYCSGAALDLRWHHVTKRGKVDFSHYHGVIPSQKNVRIVCLFSGAQPTTESENLNEKSVESLSSDFSHLLEKEILPDVKLECGGQTLQAHRSVLAARSQVFRAMFQNEMLESKTGAVKIQDMDVAVLEKLLKFVYTGKPEDISESTAADLYEAADKYDVHSLKTICAYWIARNLTVENFVKYLIVADSHSDHDLRATVVSFILEKPSVLKSEAWLTFSKEPSKLANEVFQAYVAATVQ